MHSAHLSNLIVPLSYTKNDSSLNIMDPISAFGLAVNVLAVVDFSKTFLEVLGQVRDAGSPAAARDINRITRSLQASNEKIKNQSWIAEDNQVGIPLTSLLFWRQRQSLTGSMCQAFKDLVDECQKLSEELIGLAEKVSVSGPSTLAAKIKVTARAMWSHSEIEEKKARLEGIRGQLLFDIVVPMAEKINTNPDTSALDTQTRTLLNAIKSGEDTNKAIEERLRSFHQEYAAAQQEQHIEVVSLLHDIRDVQSRHVSSAHREVAQESKEMISRRILNSLYFDQEKDRYDDIDSAHKGTFEWIYSEPPSGATGSAWSNFHNWLRDESGIYWVSGKAGSGKSTLMKLLATDDRTRDSLLKWGTGGRLLVLSFYFWNPGTPLQKSLEGLFRSILLQSLQACPELGEKLFPDRFEHDVQWGQFPTMHQLKRAFTYLTAEETTDASGVPLKLALLIDGLDEFDTGALNHSELSKIFTSAAESSSFKAVLSSRPENAFEDAFRHQPKLRLHHLTRSDVVRYVNDKLRDHPRMQQLVSRSPKDTEALVSEIMEAAQGVFLWVRLVVRSLLEGLQNHDEIGILTERLHELPTDLEQLFRYMLQRVPSRYNEGMSKMFQLLRGYNELQSSYMQDGHEHMASRMHPLTALGLYFALLDEKTILQTEPSQFTVEEASIEIISIEAKMKSHCAGFIELSTADDDVQGASSRTRVTAEVMSPGSPITDGTHNWVDPRVQFIHRSVTEYLWKEEVWNTIIARTDHLDFHPSVATLRSVVMQAKKCPFEYKFNETRAGHVNPWDLVGVALEVAYQLEKGQETAQTELLDSLEVALTTRCGPDWWDTYEEDYNRAALWHDNFFAFTVRYGLWRYVQARLQKQGRKSTQKRGRPLLDYACRPEPRYGEWLRAIDVRIVEALLQNGADPNLKFNGFTPWQNAWYTAWGYAPASRLLPVLEVLLAYGADPNAYIEKKGWRRTVLQVAQSSEYRHPFNDEVQVEQETVDNFIRMLKKRGAKAKEWREENEVFVSHRTSLESSSSAEEVQTAPTSAEEVQTTPTSAGEVQTTPNRRCGMNFLGRAFCSLLAKREQPTRTHST